MATSNNSELDTSVEINSELTWDIDGNGKLEASTDGQLFLRYLADFSEDTLIKDVIGSHPTRATADDISTYIEGLKSTIADIDDDGELSFLTDGLLLVRYLANFTGNALIKGVVPHKAGRQSADALIEYMDQYRPPISISIDDDVIDNMTAAAENGTDLTISGTTEWVEDRRTVTLTLNGKSYTAIVNNHTWSLNISAADIQALPEGKVAIRVYVNAAGNAYVQDSFDGTATIGNLAITSGSGADTQYLIGDSIRITLNMNEAVTVTGSPTIKLNIGGTERTAEYSSGSGTDQLVFTYKVTQIDSADGDGISVVANSLELNGGSLTDVVGNTITDLNHTALNATGHKVHTSTPIITASSPGFISHDIIGDDSISSLDTLSADFNDDGYIDLYVTYFGQNQLWQGDGNGGFSSSNIIGDNDSSSISRSAVAADFNKDGNIDIYVAQASFFGTGAKNKLWLGQDDGSFTSSSISDHNDISYNAVVADFNKDGSIDLYVANKGQNRLLLSNNDDFISADIGGDVDFSQGAVTADFNNDGNSDIYVTNDGQNRLWLGDGEGNFISADISDNTDNSYNAIATDFNNDGNVDIYVANSGGQNRLWLGKGDATFTNADIMGDTDSSYDAITADFNADGNADIYVTNNNATNNNQNRLWLGDGEGNFISADINGDIGSSHGATTADFNGDGNMDIYVANFDQNKLWLQGSPVAVDVTLGTTGAAGDTLRLYSGVEGKQKLIASKLLTENDIATSQVTLKLGSVAEGDGLQTDSSLTLDANGDWALAYGQQELTAKITTSEGTTQSLTAFTLLVKNPNLPAISIDAITGDNVVNASDSSSDLAISGTTYRVEDGQMVKVTLNGTIYTASVSNNAWELATGATIIQNLLKGTYTISADVTDVAGNAASQNGPITSVLIVDTSISTPSIALQEDTGSNQDDYITRNKVIEVSGLEQGATWEYSLDNGSNWEKGYGSSFALPDGIYDANSIQVHQTDAAGNTSVAGTLTNQVTIDTSAPKAPSLTLNADTSTSATDKVTNDPIIHVGNIDSETTWEYSTDSGNTWIPASDKSYGFTLAEGTYVADSIQVRQINVAGNTSAAGTLTKQITIDTSAPNPPSLTLNADTGTSATDKVTNDPIVNVDDIDSETTWVYSTDSGSTWTLGSGNSFTLAEGTYVADSIQVHQTDAAGNTSDEASIASQIIIDTSAPNNAPSLTLNADTGTSATDKVTNDPIVNVDDIDSETTWVYSTDSGSTWTLGSGNSFTLAEGTYVADSIQVRQTDAAGNTSAADTLTKQITIDTSAPNPPSLTLNADTGTNATDKITNDPIVNVDGIDSETIWEYSTDSGSTWTLGSGNSFTLAEGTYVADSIQVRQVDAAGNSSIEDTLDFVVTIDTSAPAPNIALKKDTGDNQYDGITSNNAIKVYGLEQGATWEYSTNGGYYWTQGSNNSFTLADGTYSANKIRVRQTDKAGNRSNAGTLAKQVTIDTNAPAAPNIALQADTGSNKYDGVTSNKVIEVYELEQGATWEYSTNGGSYWSQGSGSSFTLAVGTYSANSIKARQTDTAGNLSQKDSINFVVTITTTTPSPPWPPPNKKPSVPPPGKVYNTDNPNADSIAPTVESVAISSVASTDTDTLASGSVQVTISMSEDVIVTGSPSITLDIGGSLRAASYSGSPSTDTLMFEYQLSAADSDTSGGISLLADSLTLNGGSITDLEGLSADLSHLGLTAFTGTEGADTLIGTEADDIITGLAGDDTLTGGDGSDTFDYNSTDAGNDSITDFSLGIGGDRIDLSDLLSGYDPSSSELSDFISVFDSSDINKDSPIHLLIDADGDNEGNDNFSPHIIIALNTIAPPDDLDTFVADLVANGNLILA